MVLNSNALEDKAEIKNLEERAYGSQNAVSESFQSLYYPFKRVKRFIFKPYLGKRFPYVDVESIGHDMQLSLFFGKINMKFSVERQCSYCNQNLNDINWTDLHISVSLCSNCFSKIYYRYWSCVKELYNDTFTKYIENENSKENFNNLIPCEDLLAPKCGYPIESERTNPCLKNHAIGILMIDDSTFKIVVGPLDSLKYKMIWEGGLFGLIFGYSNRIMNLEILKNKLGDFFLTTKSYMEKFNETDIIHDNFGLESFLRKDKIKLISQYSNLKNCQENPAIFQWILMNFLRYYKNYQIQQFISKYFDRPLYFLRTLIERLTEKNNLELLQFIKLYKYFTPISLELRQYYEQVFKKLLGVSDIRYFSTKRIERSNNLTLSEILKTIAESTPFVDFNELGTKEIELREVLCSFGSLLIVDSNISKVPMLLHLSDLVGRTIY